MDHRRRRPGTTVLPLESLSRRAFAEICRVLRPGAALFATDARNLDFLREFHEDDVFVPLPEDTIVSRLSDAGFVDADLQIADYEHRFSARKPTS